MHRIPKKVLFLGQGNDFFIYINSSGLLDQNTSIESKHRRHRIHPLSSRVRVGPGEGTSFGKVSSNQKRRSNARLRIYTSREHNLSKIFKLVVSAVSNHPRCCTLTHAQVQSYHPSFPLTFRLPAVGRLASHQAYLLPLTCPSF